MNLFGHTPHHPRECRLHLELVYFLLNAAIHYHRSSIVPHNLGVVLPILISVRTWTVT